MNNTQNDNLTIEKDLTGSVVTKLYNKCMVDDGIFIRQKDFFKKFLYADIHWIEASGNYCYIHLKNKQIVLIIISISELEKIFPADRFIRIHRSCIVNAFAVDSFIGNMLCIGTVKLPVSAPYRLSVLSCFTILTTSKVFWGAKK